jgi:hypothetical protein
MSFSDDALDAQGQPTVRMIISKWYAWREGECRKNGGCANAAPNPWPSAELSKTMSMKIGKCKHINALAADHWKKMADETGLGWPMIRDRIGEMATGILDHSAATGKDLPAIEPPMLERVIDIVTNRAKKMRPAVA